MVEPAQRLVRVDATSEDEGGVVAPGSKAEVIFVNVERQLLIVGSVLSEFKNVVQGALIPEGMRGLLA